MNLERLFLNSCIPWLFTSSSQNKASLIPFIVGKENKWTVYGCPLQLYQKSSLLSTTWDREEKEKEFSTYSSIHLLPSTTIPTEEIEFKYFWSWINGLNTIEVVDEFLKGSTPLESIEKLLYYADWFNIDLQDPFIIQSTHLKNLLLSINVQEEKQITSLQEIVHLESTLRYPKTPCFILYTIYSISRYNSKLTFGYEIDGFFTSFEKAKEFALQFQIERLCMWKKEEEEKGGEIKKKKKNKGLLEFPEKELKFDFFHMQYTDLFDLSKPLYALNCEKKFASEGWIRFSLSENNDFPFPFHLFSHEIPIETKVYMKVPINPPPIPYNKVKEFKGTEAEVFHADTPAYYLPEKKDVYTKMEALIYHFKIIMGETDIPVGELYSSVEGANGELGFYLISDGGRTPYRLHFRRPCFIYYQAFEELVKGGMLSDAVITMSSLNLIAGELDA